MILRKKKIGHKEAAKFATVVDFHVDLDLLAPLGSREGNAVLHFRDFAKPAGSRLHELSGIERAAEGVGAHYPALHAAHR